MKYRLKIYTELTVARFHPRYKQAQKFIDSEVLRDSQPYVPYLTGYLMNSGNTGTVIGSGEIEYNAPYAKAVYYGVHRNFSKLKHPQASAQWFEKAKAAKLKDWVSGVQRIIRGG